MVPRVRAVCACEVLSKYNEKFPRQAIRKFDKITAVNGKVGNANDLRRTPHREP